MKFRKQEAVTDELSRDFDIVCTKCDTVIESLYNRNAGEIASEITNEIAVEHMNKLANEIMGECINKILKEHKCKEEDE